MAGSHHASHTGVQIVYGNTTCLGLSICEQMKWGLGAGEGELTNAHTHISKRTEINVDFARVRTLSERECVSTTAAASY